LGDFKKPKKKAPYSELNEEWGVGGFYCINGITSGYLKNSPLGALTLAIITQTTLSVISKKTIGIPIMMKHKGAARTMYSNMDNWKLRDAFPFIFTHDDSSFLVSQQIRGPITPPNGKKKPAKAER
jgi:hypothetical protein